jgi:hypothetical protein
LEYELFEIKGRDEDNKIKGNIIGSIELKHLPAVYSDYPNHINNKKKKVTEQEKKEGYVEYEKQDYNNGIVTHKNKKYRIESIIIQDNGERRLNLLRK